MSNGMNKLNTILAVRGLVNEYASAIGKTVSFSDETIAQWVTAAGDDNAALGAIIHSAVQRAPDMSEGLSSKPMLITDMSTRPRPRPVK